MSSYFSKALAFAFLVLAGSLIHSLLLKKFRVRLSILEIFVIWAFGWFALNSDVKFLSYLGFIITAVATALGFYNIFGVMPKEEDTKSEGLVLKANSGSINDDEAHSLLKKAIHHFIVMPKKEKDAILEGLVLKANSGSISDDEAYSLLKKAIYYEKKGQTEDAKVLYELLVKSNTSLSSDAQSCLKNLK